MAIIDKEFKRILSGASSGGINVQSLFINLLKSEERLASRKISYSKNFRIY